jgi:2-C-methyl-D-erythritol 4-phosphate cytidylyltransferase
MLSAIIVAAGASERMGFDKLLAPLGGKPLVAHTIDAFEQTRCVDEIVLVGRNDMLDQLRKLLGPKTKVHQLVPGGALRHDSVRAGLQQVDTRADYVAVHDAARPLITPEKITRVFQAARQYAAAALAEAISDTLKRADVDAFESRSADVLVVRETVDRDQLFAMQTPQVFARELLVEAYEALAAGNISVTDEVSAVQLLGRKVVLVPNQDFNFKITYPRDFLLAEFVFRHRSRQAS